MQYLEQAKKDYIVSFKKMQDYYHLGQNGTDGQHSSEAGNDSSVGKCLLLVDALLRGANLLISLSFSQEDCSSQAHEWKCTAGQQGTPHPVSNGTAISC